MITGLKSGVSALIMVAQAGPGEIPPATDTDGRKEKQKKEEEKHAITSGRKDCAHSVVESMLESKKEDDWGMPVPRVSAIDDLLQVHHPDSGRYSIPPGHPVHDLKPRLQAVSLDSPKKIKRFLPVPNPVGLGNLAESATSDQSRPEVEAKSEGKNTRGVTGLDLNLLFASVEQVQESVMGWKLNLKKTVMKLEISSILLALEALVQELNRVQQELKESQRYALLRHRFPLSWQGVLRLPPPL